jgi:hypothetical protein
MSALGREQPILLRIRLGRFFIQKSCAIARAIVGNRPKVDHSLAMHLDPSTWFV